MSRATDLAFGMGYQAALRDLAEANERGGLDALIEWLYDNASDEQVRALVRHLVKPEGGHSG